MIDCNLIPIVATAGPSMAIPGPYWLFTILHWLTFSLHLTAMNILFGGLLILLIFKSNPANKALFPAMTSMFPTTMAATITLGVAPLLFLQVMYGKFFYSASIIAGWNWLLIIPVVLVVYYLLYMVAMRENITVSGKIKLLMIVLVGFIYVSYTLTLISDLTEKPDLLPELYQASGGWIAFSPNFVETLFRWLHMISGALAVAGIFMQLLSIYHKKLKGDRDLLQLGSRSFLHGVILATLFGLIYLFTWDVEVIKTFLKSPGLHAIIGAIVLNVIALVLVFRIVKSERPHLKIWTAAVSVFAGVFCMVIARHSLRLIHLKGHFDPAALTYNPQWSVFLMFLLSFLVGLVILYWMIRKYFSSSEAPA
jgi:hypothetical protein